jgi:hypothetical protein
MLDERKINGHGNMYIIVFGYTRYRVEDHYRSTPKQYQFSSLTEARKMEAKYSNAYIFKLHFKKGDDEPDISFIY